MKFPWVSREHMEDTQRLLQARVEELDAERLRLLNLLLEGAVPARQTPVRATERSIEEQPEPSTDTTTAEQGTPVAYSTPFDRTKARFNAAHKGGRIPAEFRARMS